MSLSSLERKFELLWEELFPDIDLLTEVKIIKNRRFKFDYVVNHPEIKIAIEINGLIWHKGGHSSGQGLMRDYLKLNLANLENYQVFQLSSEMICEEWILNIGNYIKKLLASSGISRI